MAPPPRIFGQDDRNELLKALAVAREGCTKALLKLPAGRSVMKSGVECLTRDIDDLAALLTGNPDHFKGKNASPSYG
jgi:hypothetical protein